MAHRFEHFPNLVSLFFARAAEQGDAPFLWRKADGAWRPQSWAETARQIAALALALRGIGLAPGDRVLLVSENRPEWCVADLAIMAAGCVSVPAYTSNTTADHAHVLGDSGARAAIVSTARLAAALLPAVRAAPDCARVIAMEPIDNEPEVLDFHAMTARDGDVAACAAAATFARGDLACIIYTSGTGGSPRGVMHHHGAILHNVAGAAEIIGGDFAPTGEDEAFLSFLPLSHAYEHSGGLYLPIGLAAQIYYAEGLDKLAANIAEVRPSIMIVVPRLFEMLRQRIVRAVEKQGPGARWLLGRALALAARDRRRRRDAPLRLLLARTIAPRVAAQFGGRIKALVSGGAPLNPEVGRFFQLLGLTVLQGYGQTESGPIVSVNRPRAGIAMETVGPPIAGTEVAIGDDGEILVRGENVMHGYWRDEAASEAALAGGWLHTGDVGHLDAAGRLVITDRKKDLIVNDKGENVSPQRVEGMLTLRPEILQAMVVGDKRPYLTALIALDPEWAAAAGLADDEAALARALQGAVDAVNKGLSVTERVRRFARADEPFSIANGQLTPSLKIRRHVIRGAYGERLDKLYAG